MGRPASKTPAWHGVPAPSLCHSVPFVPCLPKLQREAPRRKLQQNPVIQQLYDDFLEKPNSHKAHELLHTYYLPCGPEKFDINSPPEELPLATCTIDLGHDAVCDQEVHHEVCNMDDGNPTSDSDAPPAPTALHGE
ncbi:hypothetical protein CHLNCDRAFT_133208 [Chlorella variabilis]|uniref:Iron hydrogenase small subunit domain-containing protein n=1 Tax=Chlorella variabilis TaxID=554065 RepID=E1Z2L5_CHLVA|nr:hypothetical protein CHLNCDRAFT_133208 [Chlorella variabilis]EFN60019.1 hypothetical protein CHLNCDRAFT_133208 [Chlorella variabilis]|eukprot:XP_005852121.1 hypothetical protein CHLNCDRAFT_133208 [Chlorella variabilis]